MRSFTPIKLGRKKNNNDIEKIVDIFKKYNIRCENDFVCTCYSTITLPKTYHTEAGTFKKGTTLLFLEGDRHAVRNAYNLFDMDQPERPLLTAEELKMVCRTKIVFVDWVYEFLEDLKNGKIIENRLYLNK